MTIEEIIKVCRGRNFRYARSMKKIHRDNINQMYWDKVERLAKKEGKHVRR